MRWLSMLAVLVALQSLAAAADVPWWNAQWRYRTTIACPSPCRDPNVVAVEVPVDFAGLLRQAGVSEPFDPASVRVVPCGVAQAAEIPCAYRQESAPMASAAQAYLTWFARPELGRCAAYDVYFDTRSRGIAAAHDSPASLPPENLLANAGFEEVDQGQPRAWLVSRTDLVRLQRHEQTQGRQSLAIVVDENTPPKAPREVTVSQTVDVRPFAGQEMVFQCDLLAHRAAYGAPVSIQLRQARADGSPIGACAVDPRWLTIELAQGQLVQFCERGRFDPEAASLDVRVLFRCQVTDEDTARPVEGPESYFTVFLDRVVVRPGQRWPWPAASRAGFATGALPDAPLNLGLDLTGQRRLIFNGASEATLTTGQRDPGPQSVHWGLVAGTLEFWCQPHWNTDDGIEHVFFEGVAYGHRLQSLLRKLDKRGGNQLEFAIADSNGKLHKVRGAASFRAGQWHHLAATWDLSRAHLQLFVDGKPVAAQGPDASGWPCSLTAAATEKRTGMGIGEEDQRSLPMQAFVGGDHKAAAEGAAEAVLDELRISDVVRYAHPFAPSRSELALDNHTRALFHFENERDGGHAGDDRFVRGHLCVELPPQQESAPLETRHDGQIQRRMLVVAPHASAERFEANRAENRLTVTRPWIQPPDPRFVEHRPCSVQRIVRAGDESFTLSVSGDYEPRMGSVSYEFAEPAAAATSLLPHWLANDNVLPLSPATLRETLPGQGKPDLDKAFQAFKYALQTTNYYNAGYCETIGTRHRERVAYTLIKALNIYPFDQCGPLNHTLRKLFLCAGISSNDASGTHHQFEQAFYDGAWRLFDLSPRKYWLNRDNVTLVGRRGIEEDPYLKIRQGGDVCAWLRGRASSTRFGAAVRPHSMDFPLRPGERASLCWHNEGRWFEMTGKRQPLPLAMVPPMFGNGAILYEPAPGDATHLEGLEIARASDGRSRLHAQDASATAALVYRARCPYIFSDAVVCGDYTAQAPGAVRLAVSFDEGRAWNEVWRSPDKAGTLAVELGQQVTARYAYWLKLELAPGQGAEVRAFQVRSTLVVSPLSLPGRLALGENRIRFVGATPSAPIQTVCRWAERHRSDLGVSLNTLSFYTAGDDLHRNLLVVPPDGEASLRATFLGTPVEAVATLDGLPAGWTCRPLAANATIARPGASSTVEMTVRAAGSQPGEIRRLYLAIRHAGGVRRVPLDVLVAEAPLIREAETADAMSGDVSSTEVPELSGAACAQFQGSGRLTFQLAPPKKDRYALWLRARWEPESSTQMTLTLDGAPPRPLQATGMIGFSDWTNPKQAHTKMFAHFGEQYAHWAWYRVPDLALSPQTQRLELSASRGACLDALLILPQNSQMDRAAMNLLQNWNYAPWRNPL